MRQDEGLAELIGHELPAARTARDILAQFHEDDLPLLRDGKASVPSVSAALQGLAAANMELILDLQCRKPQKIATLVTDATVIHSCKTAAKRTDGGERGYQPVLVLWAEQAVIFADEFHDGNVPASMGNLRVIQKVVAALPGTFDEMRLRGDAALYEHDAMTRVDDNRIRYAISVRMSTQIKACIEALPETHWKPAGEEGEAIREWAEINDVPRDGNWSKQHATPRRYLAIRIKPRQGELLGDGANIEHFAIVTNRNDPEGGSGLDLICWQRQRAGTIEHAHDVLVNELAGWCLPSQKFGANAAWLRLNVLLYDLLSAFKRVGLPEEMHDARPKRLRYLVLNTLGTVVRHARESLLRYASALARAFADAPRLGYRLLRPALPGERGPPAVIDALGPHHYGARQSMARSVEPPPCTWFPRGRPGGRGVNARQRDAPTGAISVRVHGRAAAGAARRGGSDAENLGPQDVGQRAESDVDRRRARPFP